MQCFGALNLWAYNSEYKLWGCEGGDVDQINTLRATPPLPLLLKTTHLAPEALAALTKLLMYSLWECPVNPGRRITIGVSGLMLFSSNQSKDISPPSFNLRTSLKKNWKQYKNRLIGGWWYSGEDASLLFRELGCHRLIFVVVYPCT